MSARYAAFPSPIHSTQRSAHTQAAHHTDVLLDALIEASVSDVIALRASKLHRTAAAAEAAAEAAATSAEVEAEAEAAPVASASRCLAFDASASTHYSQEFSDASAASEDPGAASEDPQCQGDEHSCTEEYTEEFPAEAELQAAAAAADKAETEAAEAEAARRVAFLEQVCLTCERREAYDTPLQVEKKCMVCQGKEEYERREHEQEEQGCREVWLAPELATPNGAERNATFTGCERGLHRRSPSRRTHVGAAAPHCS